MLGYKANHERDMNGLIGKLESTAELNERYMQLCSRNTQM